MSRKGGVFVFLVKVTSIGEEVVVGAVDGVVFGAVVVEVFPKVKRAGIPKLKMELLVVCDAAVESNAPLLVDDGVVEVLVRPLEEATTDANTGVGHESGGSRGGA